MMKAEAMNGKKPTDTASYRSTHRPTGRGEGKVILTLFSYTVCDSSIVLCAKFGKGLGQTMILDYNICEK